MKNQNISNQMRDNGYVVINHSNKLSRKNILSQANNLANYFLKRNTNKKNKKIISKIISSNELNQESLYKKFKLLKSKNPKDSSRLYNILGKDIYLSNHHNDKNIINALNILFEKKNIFNIAQQIRIDLSPQYHHALAWHQDHFDLPSMNKSGLFYNFSYKDSYTVWSPFTKADKKIGTMQVLEGSHKFGRLNHSYKKNTVRTKSAYLELKIPEKILNKCKKKIIEIDSSQSIIFSMNLIHGTIVGNSEGVRLTGWCRFTSTSSKSFNKMVNYA